MNVPSTREKLYGTESEWLETGRFELNTRSLSNFAIRTAKTTFDLDQPNQLVVFVGGIPKDRQRCEVLPLINRFHGLLALKVADEGMVGLAYNQPGTGGSTGNLETDTMADKIELLRDLTMDLLLENDLNEVSFVGMSAGSYVAARASELLAKQKVKVNSLILQSPALYPAHVEGIAYGNEFRATLSEHWSHKDSPVFNDLDSHLGRGGRVHITYFQRDDPPIPIDIQETYMNWVMSREHGDASITSITGVEHNFRKIGHDSGRNVVDNNAIRKVARELVTIIV